MRRPAPRSSAAAPSSADAHTVHLLAENRSVTAEYVLIATGGEPRRDLAIPGIEHAITSNEFFNLPHQPRRVLIVGGSYVAVEIASVFAALGTRTTLAYRGDQILRGFDDEVRQTLRAGMERRGVTILTGEEPASIEKAPDCLAVATKSGKRLAVDEVLLAIGRRPNVRDLGLDRAGVTTDAAGAVTVDAWSRTSADNIYAVGDVTARMQFTPVAIREAAAFVDDGVRRSSDRGRLRQRAGCGLRHAGGRRRRAERAGRPRPLRRRSTSIAPASSRCPTASPVATTAC